VLTFVHSAFFRAGSGRSGPCTSAGQGPVAGRTGRKENSFFSRVAGDRRPPSRGGGGRAARDAFFWGNENRELGRGAASNPRVEPARTGAGWAGCNGGQERLTGAGFRGPVARAFGHVRGRARWWGLRGSLHETSQAGQRVLDPALLGGGMTGHRPQLWDGNSFPLSAPAGETSHYHEPHKNGLTYCALTNPPGGPYRATGTT